MSTETVSCGECGVPAVRVGESGVALMYRCPRQHYTKVPRQAFVHMKVGDRELQARGTAEEVQRAVTRYAPDIFDQVLEAKPAPRHHPGEDTEHESAATAQKNVSGLRRQLMEMASRIQGVTGDEACKELDMDLQQTSVRPLLSQLVKMGLVRKTAMRRENRRGHREIVYRAVTGAAQDVEDVQR